MLDIEKEALQFTAFLKEQYFVKRDLQALAGCMENGTTWIGTGKNEISRNLEEAMEALSREGEEYSGRFSIAEEKVSVSVLSEDMCLVYGVLCARPENTKLAELTLHVTIICRKTDDGMKLVHCNFSRPDDDQEEGHYYVSKEARSDRQSLKNELRRREEQISNLVSLIPGGAQQCADDPEFTLLDMSEGFLKMFGYSREEIREQFHDKFMNMIAEEDREDVLRKIKKQLEYGPEIEIEYRVYCKNGESVWVLEKGRLQRDANGVGTFYCILVEITSQKQEHDELRLSLEQHRLIMDQTNDIIFEWNIEEDVLLFSSNWKKKFGYDPQTRGVRGIVSHSPNVHSDDIPKLMKMMKDIASGEPYCEHEVRFRNKNEHFIWCKMRLTTQFDKTGKAVRAVGVIIDVNSEKEEKKHLMDLAQKDALTGIYNKTAIQVCAEREMEKEGSGLPQALFMIDIDNFKAVNDTFGHLCGDMLLAEVADTLKRQFRESDLIGRIGGDEFVVYLPEIKGAEAARKKATELLIELNRIHLSGIECSVSCSIGIAVTSNRNVGYTSLYQFADKALYRQKKSGKNGVAIFDSFIDGERPGDLMSVSAIGEDIVSEDYVVVDEKLAQYTFRMLYMAPDVKVAVNQLLEIVGRACDVSRIYIFEHGGEGWHCKSTFGWDSDEPEAEKVVSGGVCCFKDHCIQKRFHEDGIYYCPDVRMLDLGERTALEQQGIYAVLQCAILDSGEFRGFIRFDECREGRIWTKRQVSTLSLIADVLAVFITKVRMEEKLNNLEVQLSVTENDER